MHPNLSRSIFSFALALAAAGFAQADAVATANPAPQQAGGYRGLKYPPVHDIKVPEPVRFELANGLVVYLIEDHELPKVGMHALVRAGGRWEPAVKTGLAEITGTVMRTGGSVSRGGDKLDDELDRLGASIETSIDQDSGRVDATMLKEDLGHGIEIVADLLQHPAFPQDKIDLAKIRMRDGIARRNDEPNGIVFREFWRILYGRDSPYARQTEYAMVDAITRDDLVVFYQRFFQPESVILGVEGDFDPVAVRAKIEQCLGAWTRGGQPKPDVPAVDPAAQNRAGVYSIVKTDMQQSWVILGMLGGRRDDPDYYALSVMNEVLGGGISSRLHSNVRSAQGLAYIVFSGWDAEWDHPGLFFAGGSSKPETTIKIYQSMLTEVKRLAESGATDDEVTRAKDSILKGFAFEFDHTSKIIGRLMAYEYYGYPRDYLQQYHARITKVTKDDVARVARQYLAPGKFAVLFSGNGRYEAPLDSLGPVKPVDITIPPPKQP
jgi:zinc protease